MKATHKKNAKVASRPKNRRQEDRKPARPPSAARRQVAALPFRRTATGDIEILLVTSRESGRFIIPKGWPMKRLDDADAAAKEAYEEAGVVGKVKRKSIGDYIYWKRFERSFELLKVDVYALEVRQQRADWPEKNARKSGWLSKEEAAKRVDEPGLVALLKEFAG
ncbi:MAG TPA: NUDIX hydrolase [Roseiarcus sp.]|jgi:8-oxo-dGTP pyrophosphatase MutT (NUDIX family)|nr:NUDIX hydrolase [Roseiarcus sp.]